MENLEDSNMDKIEQNIQSKDEKIKQLQEKITHLQQELKQKEQEINKKIKEDLKPDDNRKRGMYDNEFPALLYDSNKKHLLFEPEDEKINQEIEKIMNSIEAKKSDLQKSENKRISTENKCSDTQNMIQESKKLFGKIKDKDGKRLSRKEFDKQIKEAESNFYDKLYGNFFEDKDFSLISLQSESELKDREITLWEAELTRIQTFSDKEQEKNGSGSQFLQEELAKQTEFLKTLESDLIKSKKGADEAGHKYIHLRIHLFAQKDKNFLDRFFNKVFDKIDRFFHKTKQPKLEAHREIKNLDATEFNESLLFTPDEKVNVKNKNMSEDVQNKAKSARDNGERI